MANTHETLTNLFSDTANAIRTKTGSTAAIVADDFPTAINGIVTLSEGVANVTAIASDVAADKVFVDANGAEVTGTVPVWENGESWMVGGTSTLSYHTDWECFCFDKTFSQDTLVRRGATLSQDIASSELGDATAADVVAGKTFTSAAGLKVTGTAKKAPTLEDCSWNLISAISQDGLAANFFSVGDTKAVTLNGTVDTVTFSNQTYYAFIIGIDHNSTLEGSGIHFCLGKTAATGGKDICFVDSFYGSAGLKPYYDYFRMYAKRSSDTSIGNLTSDGWDDSWMRTVICAEFFTVLPTSLQNVVRECTKYTNNSADSGNLETEITATVEKVFIASEFEILGARSQANSYEQNYQQQYKYYQNGNSVVKYRHDNTSTAAMYWTRSPRHNNETMFVRITTAGASDYTSNATSLGFSPCFVV